MAEQPKADLDLDLKGMLCPMPIVRLSQSVGKLEVGGLVRAVTNDPVCMAEIPAWARSAGQEIVSTEHEGDEIAFLIRRVR